MNILNEQAAGVAGKDSFKVGDIAYIIESNRLIREVTIIKLDRDFCTVRFADTNGAIKIRRGRLFATYNLAEEKISRKENNKPKREGPRPPHRIW